MEISLVKFEGLKNVCQWKCYDFSSSSVRFTRHSLHCNDNSPILNILILYDSFYSIDYTQLHFGSYLKSLVNEGVFRCVFFLIHIILVLNHVFVQSYLTLLSSVRPRPSLKPILLISTQLFWFFLFFACVYIDLLS